ncbi:MAG: crossover junction endodeoxyribonuclease RuvC [Bacteroidales bacterium]|nr:crossover junction endodeoxyribonuclease RuvC [Bacteroidales bacterium]
MKNKNNDFLILGIDPGTQIMGYGIINMLSGKLSCVAFGVIELKKINDPYQKLNYIFERTSMLIKEYKPQEMAIEAPFYGKNVQSMLKLGRAQGVAIASALSFQLPVFEYSPRKIKQSITGNGNASKEQMAVILQHLLKFSEIPRLLDATDALAVAVCHSFQKNNITNKKIQTWDEFLKNNKDRIV